MSLSPSLPAELRRVIDLLRRLPGVSERVALRYALWLCLNYREAIEVGTAIGVMVRVVGRCTQCGNLASTGALCCVCADGKREDDKIAVVASVQHAIAFEASGYRGRYHVLSAMVNPLEGVSGDDIRRDLDALAMRLHAGMELIVALPSSSEGEATALEIARSFRDAGIVVTRIARGVQANGEIGEADAVTIFRAIDGRKQMEG